MTPTLIIGLRHGEKPANAEDDAAPLDAAGPGLDAQGNQSRRALTVQGWQRAGGLAATHLCGTLTDGARVRVLVPAYEHMERHRAYQTASPLARRLSVEIESPCPADQVDALHDAVLAADDVVVVCWEHDALEAFAGRLCDPAPDWPHGRFDVLWILRPQADGRYNLEQVDQNLPAGDGAA